MSKLQALAASRHTEVDVPFGAEVVRFRLSRPSPDEWIRRSFNAAQPSQVVAAELATGQGADEMAQQAAQTLSQGDVLRMSMSSRDADLRATVTHIEEEDGWREIELVLDDEEDLEAGKLGITALPDEARSALWVHARRVLGRQGVERQLRSFRGSGGAGEGPGHDGEEVRATPLDAVGDH